MNKKINLIFDFDSTFIKQETIEVLAKHSLKKNHKSKNIKKQIQDITTLAMSGAISFQKALSDRIALLDIKPDHIEKTSQFLLDEISPSFNDNINFIKENKENCYIISGGFKKIICDVVKKFDFIESNIFANEFTFYQNNISIDTKNPLSMDCGKCKIAKKIKGYNIIIGDGYTDYEVKKHGYANVFIQYVENINRNELNDKADLIATNFKDIINFINNV
tara:strand:+ start:1175 stop:1834 length:660 start_codon:yes stop_codon:yes gene_type:complete